MLQDVYWSDLCSTRNQNLKYSIEYLLIRFLILPDAKMWSYLKEPTLPLSRTPVAKKLQQQQRHGQSPTPKHSPIPPYICLTEAPHHLSDHKPRCRACRISWTIAGMPRTYTRNRTPRHEPVRGCNRSCDISSIAARTSCFVDSIALRRSSGKDASYHDGWPSMGHWMLRLERLAACTCNRLQ